MIYQKFNTDKSKISIFPPAVRYDIPISNRYFPYIEAALLSGAAAHESIITDNKLHFRGASRRSAI